MITYEYKTCVDKQQKTYLKKIRKIEYQNNMLTPHDIQDFFKKEYMLHESAEEYMYIMAFNASMLPLGVFEVSHGSSTVCALNVREIFVRLFLCGATGFVLVHNHPTHDTSPSESDFLSTKQMIKASKLLGIQFLDHIIIGNNPYSFRTEHVNLFTKI